MSESPRGPEPRVFRIPGPDGAAGRGSGPKKRRVPPALIAAIVGSMLFAATAIVSFLTQGRAEPPDAIADRFVNALIVGGSPFADDPDGPAGFRVAYDLLSKDMRAEVTLEDFVQEWLGVTDRLGFLVGNVPVRTSEPRARWRLRGGVRALRYKLFFGGGGPTSDDVPFTLTMTREDGRWVVLNYALQENAKRR